MGAGGLRIAAVRFHLHGMDQIRELDRILNEEDRDVVADQVPVALSRVELHGEAPHVARRIYRSRAAGHSRKAGEQLCLLAHLGQDFRRRIVFQTLGQFEETMRRRAARMDDSLRNPLMVEMLDLLAKDEILQQGRAPWPGLQRILIVADRRPVICGGAGIRRRGGLMTLPASSGAGVGYGRLGHGVSFGSVVWN